MATAAKAQRPVSPHLKIYQPQLTWVMSIAHRATGAGLAAGTSEIGQSLKTRLRSFRYLYAWMLYGARYLSGHVSADCFGNLQRPIACFCAQIGTFGAVHLSLLQWTTSLGLGLGIRAFA